MLFRSNDKIPDFQKTKEAKLLTLDYSYQKGQITEDDVRYLIKYWGLE